MSLLRRALARFRRSQAGSVTVEFVICVPIVLTFLLSAADYGMVMVRQVFLDRAVDIAVRQVRLGNVNATQYNAFREMVCDNTFLIADCENATAIELRPVDTVTWTGLNQQAQCVDRAADIAPVTAFIPGGVAQELMLIRVCAVVDPFLSITGMVLGMPDDGSGGYFLVSRAAFANEPA